ncbi:MAG: HEAT repeat domain-containing protein [Thermoguttaceae bacterium]
MEILSCIPDSSRHERVLLVLLAVLSVSAVRQSCAADFPAWVRNLDDAKAQAKSAGKDLLVSFTSHGRPSADNSQSNESLGSDKSADATSFRLPTAAIEQSHRLAAAELSKPKKRPAGLEDLESPQAVQRAVEQAMRDLAKVSQSERKWISDPRTRLRYLGDQAFDALVDGIRSDNRVVAVQSCALLSSHGESAVPQLISVLGTHTDKGVRAAAARALGQTYHPDAFQPLIDVLKDESQSVRIEASRALGYFRDARAIASLSMRVGDPNGHIARNSIQEIRQPLTEGPAYWPPQLLKLRKLTVDAKTLKGEQFGQPEIDVLVEHLQSEYWGVRIQCLHALAAMNARQSIPQIIASRHCDSRAHVLAQMPTPAAVDAIVKDLGSGDKSVKRVALAGIAGGGGRWAAPLLIAMLDDESLKRAAREDEPGLRRSVTWPESHRAHTALCGYFWEHGLPGESRNLASGETNDVAAEIVSLRKWWKQHGKDFLAGKHVPNPKLTFVYFGT